MNDTNLKRCDLTCDWDPNEKNIFKLLQIDIK